MSNDAKTPSAQSAAKATRLSKAFSRATRLRFLFYAAAAVFVILAIAYVDGGEEPIHPIVQTVTLSTKEEALP